MWCMTNQKRDIPWSHNLSHNVWFPAWTKMNIGTAETLENSFPRLNCAVPQNGKEMFEHSNALTGSNVVFRKAFHNNGSYSHIPSLCWLTIMSNCYRRWKRVSRKQRYQNLDRLHVQSGKTGLFLSSRITWSDGYDFRSIACARRPSSVTIPASFEPLQRSRILWRWEGARDKANVIQDKTVCIDDQRNAFGSVKNHIATCWEKRATS
jgi:hypothetical protein